MSTRFYVKLSNFAIPGLVVSARLDQLHSDKFDKRLLPGLVNKTVSVSARLGQQSKVRFENRSLAARFDEQHIGFCQVLSVVLKYC